MPAVSGVVYDTAGAAVGGRTVRAYRRDTGALLASRLSASGYVAADADYANVSLLLHCDGVNGSTQFEDSSASQKTVTAAGNVQISTAQSKFGGAAAYFDGTGDYLTAAYSSEFNFGTGASTVEFWYSSTQTTQYASYIAMTNFAWQIMNGAGNTICLWIYAINTGAPVLTLTNAAVHDGLWHHFAWVRSGDVHTLYFDGVAGATTTNATTVGNGTASLSIGRDETYGPRNYHGYLDEIRITKGVARYTADFTPPTVAHPDSSTALSTGGYSITTAYTGEVNVIALDDSGGTVTNDIIIRTTPV